MANLRNPITYAESFRLALSAVCPGSEARNALYEAFSHIARSWMHRDVAAGPGFESGISAQGVPVELSLSLLHDGSVATRFIAQPGIPGHGQVHPTCYLRQLTDALLERGLPPRRRVEADRLLRCMLDRQDRHFKGSFVIWLGAEFGQEGSTRLKLYLNPWCSEDSVGVALWRFLKAAEYDDSALAVVLNAQRLLPAQSFPNLFGVELHPGALALKVYLVVPRCCLDELSAFLNAYADPGVSSALQELSAKSPGEVHISLKLPTHAADLADTKVSLLASAFFESDEEVFRFIRRVGAPAGTASVMCKQLQSFFTREPMGDSRHITFLGFGARKWDVYFVPHG